jgi:hypothetical protein
VPTRTQTQRRARPTRARSGRSPAPQPRSARFGRSSAQPKRVPGRRRGQAQKGSQGIFHKIESALPIGGGSSAKRGKGAGSLPVVGGLLNSLGGKKRCGGKGGRGKLLGVLGAGAGAAGAAVLAKRRKGSKSDDSSHDVHGTSPSSGSQSPVPPAPPAGSPHPDAPASG